MGDSRDSPTQIMAEYPDYWSTALALINAWSEYQAKRKLYINATCAATSHKVLDIINKHYKGNLQLLKNEMRKLYANVDRMLTVFRYCCEKFHLDTVDTMWLRRNLMQSSEYKSLRGKCQRRMNAGKAPVSLREIYYKGP